PSRERTFHSRLVSIANARPKSRYFGKSATLVDAIAWLCAEFAKAASRPPLYRELGFYLTGAGLASRESVMLHKYFRNSTTGGEKSWPGLTWPSRPDGEESGCAALPPD